MCDIKKRYFSKFRFFLSLFLLSLATMISYHDTWADEYPIILETSFGSEYTKSGTFMFHRVRVDDGIIVWDQNDDIYMYNIDTGVETQITDDADVQRLPEIKDGKIIWSNETDYYLYMYDIVADVQTRLTIYSPTRANPLGFDGNKIVIGGSCRIRPPAMRVYDITSGSEESIFNGSTYRSSSPMISGNHIAYLVNGIFPYSYALYNVQNNSKYQGT